MREILSMSEFKGKPLGPYDHDRTLGGNRGRKTSSYRVSYMNRSVYNKVYGTNRFGKQWKALAGIEEIHCENAQRLWDGESVHGEHHHGSSGKAA